ncbi:DUF493 family protein [Helicobacter pametensis]|uniref:HP0495 family protein n=1 Tax=Helicobacter pametensis TaxID=95149 RepID=UPI000487E111|nr:DUF493 family protein [Helicobacter pametensis]
MQVIEGKPKIDYPTKWEYRVIGENREVLKEIIARMIQKDFEWRDGQSSSGGRFVCVVVSVEVENQEERDQIFVALKDQDEVRMVL